MGQIVFHKDMKKIFLILSVIFLFFGVIFAQTQDEISVWTRQADIGDVSMQKFLGELFLTGSNNGVPKSLDKALYWYGRAADQGDADSQFILAMQYCDSDKTKAVNYMKKICRARLCQRSGSARLLVFGQRWFCKG